MYVFHIAELFITIETNCLLSYSSNVSNEQAGQVQIVQTWKQNFLSHIFMSRIFSVPVIVSIGYCADAWYQRHEVWHCMLLVVVCSSGWSSLASCCKLLVCCVDCAHGWSMQTGSSLGWRPIQRDTTEDVSAAGDEFPWRRHLGDDGDVAMTTSHSMLLGRRGWWHCGWCGDDAMSLVLLLLLLMHASVSSRRCLRHFARLFLNQTCTRPHH